jgi:hypothetical protein
MMLNSKKNLNKGIKIKLKYLDIISADKVDYAYLLSDICGIKKWRRWHILYFMKSYRALYKEVERIRKLDLTEPVDLEDCEIQKPQQIDLITYAAMIELHSLFTSESSIDRPVGDLMADTITMACFSANNKEPYDSESQAWKDFKTRVENCDMMQMIGLYKWISKAVDESTVTWNEAFFDVEVPNPDYDDAGGKRMNQFNVLLTLQNIAKDFNVSYVEAWQVPYGMSQVSSLAQATRGYVQHNMTKIIEARMKREREMNNL